MTSKIGTIEKPRVWMNVTTSTNWKRPPVGIVRVEQEVCRGLRERLGDRFGTCVFEDGEFVINRNEREERSKEVAWPDSSFDFPSLSSIDSDSRTDDRLSFNREMFRESRPAKQRLLFETGDVLISLGLDWEWDKSGLTKALRNVKDNGGVSVVSCCYDLIPVLFPQYCVGDVANHFKEYFTNLTWASSLIMCISEQTKRDYRELVYKLGLPEIPAVVFPLGNGIPDEGPPSISSSVSEIISAPYILFVSTIERRKNHEVLYRAYHLLCKAGHSEKLPRLVFVGMPGWGVDDLLKDIELDPYTREHIVQLNHVTDTELRLLYEKCFLFAYPSLYEGWGLPVAEALSFGRPVIASDRGSIPEVGGDLVDYVDPWCASAWADKILAAVEYPEVVEEKAARIAREYVHRSWRDAADAIADAIDSIGAMAMDSLRLEPGYQLTTQVGIPYGERLLSLGKAGILTYGPYVAVAEGAVTVTIDIDVVASQEGPVLFRLQHMKGREVIAEKEVILGRENAVGHQIEIETKLDRSIEDLEIFSVIPEGLHLSINSILITVNREELKK